MPTARKKGQQAEELAVVFLKKKGYKILHTNWIFNHREIDVVAMDGDELVVIEVKMRESSFFENPEDAVSRQKIRFLVDAAEAYVLKYDLKVDIRFDVVAIVMNSTNGVDVEHFEDAFLPPLM